MTSQLVLMIVGNTIYDYMISSSQHWLQKSEQDKYEKISKKWESGVRSGGLRKCVGGAES